MADNKLDDRCMKYINSMLSHNGTLKELSIAANLLTDNSATVLADCMEVCCSTIYIIATFLCIQLFFS